MFMMMPPPRKSLLFPYTTLFRSRRTVPMRGPRARVGRVAPVGTEKHGANTVRKDITTPRSEEHTSELQSRPHLVCRLLLEKKKNCDNKVIITLCTPQQIMHLRID